MPKRLAVNIADLASPPRDDVERFMLFERYSKQKPSPDAIPFLRNALSDSSHAVVKCAAVSLGKLGLAALSAMDDLVKAATRIDGPTWMPQAYAECMEAMVAIAPRYCYVFPLIKNFIGLDNWIPLSASLKALKKIGTPEARELLHLAADFWIPQLNVRQRRFVEQLLADGD